MGRAPRCETTGLKKGPWTPEEDRILVNYIQKNGHGSWCALPKLAGLLRCGKSCRLRWTNYLRPDIKRGSFTREEEATILQLHGILGNRWSTIASQLPGRTDNEIKNFWSTHLKKRLLKMGLDPLTHAPKEEACNPSAPQRYEAMALRRHKAQWENARVEAEARLSRESLVMSFVSTAGYHANNIYVETITTPNDNPPADYFLKIWNSEAGKAFRKKTHVPSGVGNDPILSSEIPPNSVYFLSCASTQNSCDQSLNPNDKDKDNGCHQCNSASFEWNGDCNVKTPEILPFFADMSMCQTEDKATEELGHQHAVHYTGFDPELLLDFPDNDDNNNNTCSIQSESSTGFQQQFASPWPDLHDDDYWNNMPFIADASAHS